MALFDPFLNECELYHHFWVGTLTPFTEILFFYDRIVLTSSTFLADQQKTLAHHLDNIYAFEQDWQALEKWHQQIRALFNKVKPSWPPNKVAAIQDRFNTLFGKSFLTPKMVTLQLILLEKAIKNVQIAKMLKIQQRC